MIVITESWITNYNLLQDLINYYKPQSKSFIPILCSEWGQPDTEIGFDKYTQAIWLVRQFLVTSRTNSSVTIYYDWHDDGPDPNYREDHFGTVEYTYFENKYPPYTPKPGYFATQTIVRVLSGYSFAKEISISEFDEEDYVFLYSSDSKSSKDFVLVAWTLSLLSNYSIAIPLDQDNCFQQINYLGNTIKQTLCSSQKQLLVEISDAPSYLIIKETENIS